MIASMQTYESARDFTAGGDASPLARGPILSLRFVLTFGVIESNSFDS